MHLLYGPNDAEEQPLIRVFLDLGSRAILVHAPLSSFYRIEWVAAKETVSKLLLYIHEQDGQCGSHFYVYYCHGCSFLTSFVASGGQVRFCSHNQTSSGVSRGLAAREEMRRIAVVRGK